MAQAKKKKRFHLIDIYTIKVDNKHQLKFRMNQNMCKQEEI